MPEGRAAAWIASIITVAWAVSFVIDAVNPVYDPPASVHALMMIVAGSIFGQSAIRAVRKNGTGHD